MGRSPRQAALEFDRFMHYLGLSERICLEHLEAALAAWRYGASSPVMVRWRRPRSRSRSRSRAHVLDDLTRVQVLARVGAVEERLEHHDAGRRDVLLEPPRVLCPHSVVM
jgi:hypothetical protein